MTQTQNKELGEKFGIYYNCMWAVSVRDKTDVYDLWRNLTI